MIALLALLACGSSEAPKLRTPIPKHIAFATPQEAILEVMKSEPKVLGIGEFHATGDGPKVRTTIDHFIVDILPVLAPKTTDLVIETWVVDGSCGKAEAAVEVELEVKLDRPEVVADDIARLAKTAKELGVQPHALTLSCDDYAGILDDQGELVMGDLLKVLTAKQQTLALQALDMENARVVLYGGAVHNDVHPSEFAAEYSYGTTLRERAGDKYVELDIYVPELVGGIDGLEEEPWFKLLDVAGPAKTLLHERSPGSFIMVLNSSK